MNTVHNERITEPAAWRGPDLQSDDSWIIRLDDAANAEIDAALREAQARGATIPFERDDFPLPTLGPTIEGIRDRLEDGLGFALLRGLPRPHYSEEECGLIYWGIGMHLGTPVSQNTRGHMLGHVRDEGKVMADPKARAYQTTERLDFHTDQLPVDILGLFCLRTAKKGGASTIVSALTIHDVLREERPDLLKVLYQPFNLDWRGEEPEGEDPWYSTPVFGYADGRVSVRVVSLQYYESVTRYGEHLGLTPIQREALDKVQEIAHRPEMRLSMDFQEGDMQFLNNHVLLHAREAYEDHEEPDLKRHLLRMWIEAPESRQRLLPPGMEERRRYVRMGGIPAKVAS